LFSPGKAVVQLPQKPVSPKENRQRAKAKSKKRRGEKKDLRMGGLSSTRDRSNFRE